VEKLLNFISLDIRSNLKQIARSDSTVLVTLILLDLTTLWLDWASQWRVGTDSWGCCISWHRL